MKKVLFASHTANFQKFNLPLMRWFKEHGHEVHYVSMGDEPIKVADKSFVVSFNRSPYSKDNLRAYRPLKKIIDEERYDLIHCHTPMGSVVTRLAAREARKKYGTKVIYTAHGFHFFKGAPLKSWLLFYPVEKHLAKHTDLLITVNTEDYYFVKSKFKSEVAYLPEAGVDDVKFKKINQNNKAKLRRELGLKDTDYVIIYPAEISKRKNQLWLLDAMKGILKDNPDCYLLLPGSDSLNGVVQEFVGKNKIADKVHFLGYRNDIPALIAISDLSVSSSLQEGLPFNLMESMLGGVPVVATDIRGHRDLIIDGYNGYLVGIKQKKAFAERINRLRSELKLAKKFSTNSKIAIQRSLLKPIINDMAEIYTDLLITETVSAPEESRGLQGQLAFFSSLPAQRTTLKRISRRYRKHNETV